MRRMFFVSLAALFFLSGCQSSCQWTKDIYNDWFSSSDDKKKKPAKPECSADKDCQQKGKHFCDRGKCIHCRTDQDCASRNKQAPYCYGKAQCVACVEDKHCARAQTCFRNRCVRDENKEVLLAFLVAFFGFFLPIMMRLLFGQQPQLLLKLGSFALIAGVIIGAVTPVYLQMGEWRLWLFLVGGMSASLGIGLGSILASWWDDAGFALGFCALAWALHSVIIRYPNIFGANPVLFKFCVIIGLLMSAAFFVWSLDLSKQRRKRRRFKGKLVITFAGGALTVIKFISLLLEFLGQTPFF